MDETEFVPTELGRVVSLCWVRVDCQEVERGRDSPAFEVIIRLYGRDGARPSWVVSLCWIFLGRRCFVGGRALGCAWDDTLGLGGCGVVSKS